MKANARFYWVTLMALGGGAMMALPGATAASADQPASGALSTNEVRKTKSTTVATAPAVSDQAQGTDAERRARISYDVSAIARMSQGGVESSVIMAYVKNSSTVAPASAEEVLYLHDQGVSAEIITALLRRGGELRAQALQTSEQVQSPPAQPGPSPAPSAPAPTPIYTDYSTPPASTTYVYTYPRYVYAGYPAYAYWGPSFYWPSSWCYPRSYTWGARYHSFAPRPYAYGVRPGYAQHSFAPRPYGYGVRVGYTPRYGGGVVAQPRGGWSGGRHR